MSKPRQRAMNWFVWERRFTPTTEAPIEADEVPPLTDYHYVWTLVDGDNGQAYIIPGWHYVNRFAHWVTEKPWDDINDQDLIVKW